MLDDRAWALIDIIRIRGEIGYKAVTAKLDEKDRELIGYYRTLMAAAAASHQNYISSLTPKGNPSNTHGVGPSTRPVSGWG